MENQATRQEIDNFSIDCAILGFDEGELKVLLIKRAIEPGKGEYALPGGFVYLDEDLDNAPARRLHDLTGLSNIFLRQVGTFGELDRYPLRRVVTVLYCALVRVSDCELVAGEDAMELLWVPISEVPKTLVFDHYRLFQAALKNLQIQVRIDPVVFNLLPEEFTLTDLQEIYEAITQCQFDKRNFRKKILGLGVLRSVGFHSMANSHRAATFYRYDRLMYRQMREQGKLFSV